MCKCCGIGAAAQYARKLAFSANLIDAYAVPIEEEFMKAVKIVAFVLGGLVALLAAWPRSSSLPSMPTSGRARSPNWCRKRRAAA
jgi:hypothetical protein